MECIFCKIVRNEVQNVRIFEDEDLVVVLDIFPANPGQVLIIPKQHIERIESAPDGILSKIFVLSKYIILALEISLKISDFNIILSNGPLAGQRIHHIALFIIPRVQNDKVVIEWERKQVDFNTLQQLGEVIRNSLLSLFKTSQPKEKKKVTDKQEKKENKKVYKNVFRFLP